jgi:hypothetical protein
MADLQYGASDGLPNSMQFSTTHWSMVLAAGRRGTVESDSALERLCKSYWPPLYAYVCRQFLKRDPHKLHVVDPFDYVDEPLRTKLMSFNARKAKPLGGRIDYDIDGKLVGNWYREGTGGYAGLDRRWDYWVGHLTFAYHNIDPSQVIISIGDIDGRARQFAVRGNSPDPGQISATDGLVKYSLIAPNIDSRTGQPFARFEERYFGVLLVQLLEDRKLKLEVFPAKALAEVRDFSANAAIYER